MQFTRLWGKVLGEFVLITILWVVTLFKSKYICLSLDRETWYWTAKYYVLEYSTSWYSLFMDWRTLVNVQLKFRKMNDRNMWPWHYLSGGRYNKLHHIPYILPKSCWPGACDTQHYNMSLPDYQSYYHHVLWNITRANCYALETVRCLTGDYCTKAQWLLISLILSYQF